MASLPIEGRTQLGAEKKTDLSLNNFIVLIISILLHSFYSGDFLRNTNAMKKNYVPNGVYV